MLLHRPFFKERPVEVFNVVLACPGKKKKTDPMRSAPLVGAVYNHYAANLDRPSELLCEKYDALIP